MSQSGDQLHQGQFKTLPEQLSQLFQVHQGIGSSGQEPMIIQSSISQTQSSQSSQEQGGVGSLGQSGSMRQELLQTWKSQVTVVSQCSSEIIQWHCLQGQAQAK